MKRLLLLFAALLFVIGKAHSQNLEGGPLPVPWITQESHDRVTAASGIHSPADYHGDHLYVHWLASGDTILFFGDIIEERTQQLIACQEELEAIKNPPEPEVPEGCENPKSYRDDGSLWKPKSDNTGNPVILYDRRFTGQLDRRSCELFTAAAARIGSCPFRTVANGGREHYNVNQRATSLPSNIFVRLRKSDGTFDCRVVPDPTQRYD